MEYIAVTFRSRQHTVRFYEFLVKSGVSAEIINTPKEAGVGCGLSVKIGVSDFGRAKHAVKNTGFSTFAGFFLVKMDYGRRSVRSI